MLAFFTCSKHSETISPLGQDCLHHLDVSPRSAQHLTVLGLHSSLLVLRAIPKQVQPGSTGDTKTLRHYQSEAHAPEPQELQA